MENLRSNRIKNSFLLAICLSEIGTTISIVFGVTLLIPEIFSIGIKQQDKTWLLNPSFSFPTYNYLVGSSTSLFTNSITITSLCATAFFIRILT
eukprot:TRINITY_DN15925_c0_g1_i1.p1 TRINITY_DN15925_c0_g1~~TRINITY_DN15925_c0_g1_i1.p1  ORF type:complete len:105 (-),score=2.91 TRINITY_DN15925_c0_g1_i1:53-334(-)